APRSVVSLRCSAVWASVPAPSVPFGVVGWHARARPEGSLIWRELAAQSGNAKLWLNVAQLELEQANWQAGLEALKQAERAGAERRQVRARREWAEGELSFERQRQVARINRNVTGRLTKGRRFSCASRLPPAFAAKLLNGARAQGTGNNLGLPSF